MSHIFRFLAKLESPSHWVIQGDELHHLRQVLRLPVGTVVEVLDGHGETGRGVLKEISALSARVFLEESTFEPPPKIPLHISVGAMKPGAIDDALPSIVELGVDGIHVFSLDGAAKWRLNDKIVERWERIVTNAVKQCKRPYIPPITGYDHCGALVENIPPDVNRFVMDPDGKVDIMTAPIRSTAIWFVVGGEQGLSDRELKFFEQSGFIKVSMGTGILRAFTATIAGSALWDQRRRSLI